MALWTSHTWDTFVRKRITLANLYCALNHARLQSVCILLLFSFTIQADGFKLHVSQQQSNEDRTRENITDNLLGKVQKERNANSSDHQRSEISQEFITEKYEVRTSSNPPDLLGNDHGYNTNNEEEDFPHNKHVKIKISPLINSDHFNNIKDDEEEKDVKANHNIPLASPDDILSDIGSIYKPDLNKDESENSLSQEHSVVYEPEESDILTPESPGIRKTQHLETTTTVASVTSSHLEEVVTGSDESKQFRSIEELKEFEASDEAAEMVGVPERSKEDVPNDPKQLKNLVMSLQAQLIEAQTSQVYTRSILNVIQERQDAQAEDLKILKDSILLLSTEQKKDRVSIKTLQEVAEDNAWGISDLKSGNNDIRNDLGAFKELQLSHNDTMIELENFAGHNRIDHDTYHKAIQHLQHEVSHLKSQLQQNRIGLNRLSTQFQVANRLFFKKANAATPGAFNAETEESGIESGSGDRSNERESVSKEFDKFASSIEEKHNVIGNEVIKLLAREQEMNDNFERVNKKVAKYEGELAKVYTMFYNLSLKVENMEKKLLKKQLETFQIDLNNLQNSFLNFTQQIMHLQKQSQNLDNSHSNNYHSNKNQKYIYNKTENGHNMRHRHNLKSLEPFLSEQNERITYLENSLMESKAANQQSHILTNKQFSKLNATVLAVRKMVTDHHGDTKSAFEELRTRFMDTNTKIQHNGDRITRMEVKVLNVSLKACEKTNSDLEQDKRLESLDRGLAKLHHRSQDLSDKLSKIDRSLSIVHEKSDTQKHTMSKILGQVNQAIDVLPKIKSLQREVRNFIGQLPQDCDAIIKEVSKKENRKTVDVMRDQQYHVDGKLSYLIHPGKSSSSAWVPCDFEKEHSWTVIQKRVDGQQSFANTWEQYKYGFGDPEHEYWIGNDNLHFLTHQNSYILHIDMWDLENRYWYAEYDYFQVDSEADNYSLSLGGFQGNATDALKYSNYMPFSTMDHDNDVSSTHCAKFYTAGWWYKHCHYGNLNGRYTVGIVWFNNNLDEWVQMQRTIMKIRPRQMEDDYFSDNDIESNSTEQKYDDYME